ncbi:unnamed protein product [Ilex paraguariensis]|uniref:Uncharacterized protein n=1 Tax=Ilex paraguariensis TaxID=185542 RepID=A0ABC8U5X2_9AQUA
MGVERLAAPMACLEATSAKEVNSTWEVVMPTRRWVERHQSQATTKKKGLLATPCKRRDIGDSGLDDAPK